MTHYPIDMPIDLCNIVVQFVILGHLNMLKIKFRFIYTIHDKQQTVVCYSTHLIFSSEQSLLMLLYLYFYRACCSISLIPSFSA